MSVGLGAALIRRRVFDDIGLLDETLHIGEDQDWFLRVRERNIPMVFLREVTLLFQRHAENITNDFDHTTKNIKIAMKRSIDRRKALHGKPYNLQPLSAYDDAK
jgi:GT2 family glycosyltransferase